MTPAADVNRRARDAVANVLPRSVEIDARGPSLIVNDVAIKVAWVGEGWLRNVRPVLEGRNDRPDILVGRRMSPGARKAIANAGLSWVDETGAAEIAIDSIIVSRPGHPTEPSTVWTTSVLAVAEALLCGVRGTVKATREATGLSIGSCTNALRVLEDLGLLVSDADRGRNSARRLENPDRLLDAYASEVAKQPSPPSLQLGVTWRDPVDRLADIGRTWDSLEIAWACTGAVAAGVIAPHLTSSGSADVYVEAGTLADLEAVGVQAGLRPIEGGRLTIRPFPTVTSQRFSERIRGLRVAPWPRVYADLRTIGVRGEEAAEHLREIINGPESSKES